MNRDDKIRSLARECATEAAAQVQPQNRTLDILPEEPQRGDWEYLEEQMGETSRDEQKLFQRAYCEQIEKECELR
jgi:hypothetical protein